MNTRKSIYNIDVCACTHLGLKKKSNQDRLVMRKAGGRTALFSVIDGLGGQAGGGEAADTALSVFEKYNSTKKDSEKTLAALLLSANNAIIERGDKYSELYGMGAAATVLLITNSTAHWGHIGDCRLYHVHEGEVKLLTSDQNLAWELFEKGKISAEERQTHRFNRFLSQCLGEDDIEPATGTFSVVSGDRLLLCSDGLHDLLPQQQITEILLRKTALQTQVEELCTSALEAGGNDNIAVLLLNIR